MMIDTAQQIAVQLSDRVRQIPGVTTLYSTQPLASSMLRTAIGTVVPQLTGADLITVAFDESAIMVDVCIGVTAADPAPDVCQRVYESVDSFLHTLNSHLVPIITVTVGSVH